jgi:2'-5' RNA ligase
MRLFAALPVSEAVRDSLTAVAARLKTLCPGVAVPRPEGLHFTLFFFGERGPDEAEAMRALLTDPQTELTPRVSVSWRGVGTFPAAGPPRVIFADVAEGRREIITLQERLGRALARAGLAVSHEKRPFQPHLTLGRVKSGPVDRTLVARLALPEAAFSLDRCVLFQSLLQRDGAVYLPLAERRLDG